MEKEQIKHNIDRIINFIHVFRDKLQAADQVTSSDADFREAKKLAEDLRNRSHANQAFEDKIEREKGNNKDISAI